MTRPARSWTGRPGPPGRLDRALDRTVVPGYSRIGYWVRRRGWPEDDPAPGALAGRRALVTGASSGLGTATALGLARLGAVVHLVVRNAERGHAAADEIRRQLPGAQLVVEVCDMADPQAVRRLAVDLRARLDRVDVLVHNAGVMPPERTESSDGHELSVAVHVLGPVLLTELLLPLLGGDRGDRSRVVLVTSGGMYTQRIPLEDPDYTRGEYRGAVAYARSKRMQVALAPPLQDRWGPAGVDVQVMHPGWADTPGVAASLPLFRTLTRPLLRDAQLGADTAVWLAATRPAPPPGRLWQDRAERPAHYRRATRDTAAERERLLAWVLDALSISR